MTEILKLKELPNDGLETSCGAMWLGIRTFFGFNVDYLRHTSGDDRQDIHALRVRTMEGDRGKRLDELRFDSSYGIRTGEDIRSISITKNVNQLSFGFAQRNMNPLPS